MGRRPRRGDRPHPGAVPLQRAARLRRPPLHRPLPRRPLHRGAKAAGRLAGPGAAGPGGPPAPRGLGLRDRLLALAGLHRRRAPRPAVDRPYTPEVAAWRSTSGLRLGAAWRGERSSAELAWLGAARPRRADPLGPLRRDHHRQPALLADRHAGNGRIAETADGAGRPRPLRAAPARRSDAVAGDGRRLRRPRARHLAARAAAPRSGSSRSSSPCSPSPSSPRRAWRSSPATRCWPARSSRSSSRSPCSAGASSTAATPGACAGRSSPAIVLLMVLVWLPQPVEPRQAGPHRPHQPGPDRERPHRPRRRRRLRHPTAGRSRCRTTAPCRASPSAST